RSTSGTYDATEAVIHLEADSYDALRNGSYTIVEAAGGTVLGGGNQILYFGNDNSVLGNYFATAGISDDGSLVVDINHDFRSLPGLSSNQRSAGAALDVFMAAESTLAPGTSN